MEYIATRRAMDVVGISADEQVLTWIINEQEEFII